jgi:uncharacterized alkaline shock family protein YloU
MPDNRDYYTNREDNGSINIADDVIAVISAIAAGEVKGIAGLYTPAGVDLAEILGKKNLSKGVRIQITGRNVTIDIYVNVYYGYRIPEVATALQNAVVSAVESMTGLAVDAVNIHVGGIVFEPKTDEA